jgi:hypothetical protein
MTGPGGPFSLLTHQPNHQPVWYCAIRGETISPRARVMATTSKGFRITPDFDQLAKGLLTPAPRENLEHRLGGPTAMDALGVQFASPDTFADLAPRQRG